MRLCFEIFNDFPNFLFNFIWEINRNKSPQHDHFSLLGKVLFQGYHNFYSMITLFIYKKK